MDQRDREIERLKLRLENEKNERIRLEAVKDQQKRKIDDLIDELKHVREEYDKLEEALAESKNGTFIADCSSSEFDTLIHRLYSPESACEAT